MVSDDIYIYISFSTLDWIITRNGDGRLQMGEILLKYLDLLEQVQTGGRLCMDDTVYL